LLLDVIGFMQSVRADETEEDKVCDVKIMNEARVGDVFGLKQCEMLARPSHPVDIHTASSHRVRLTDKNNLP
jgi:hypothetical protein